MLLLFKRAVEVLASLLAASRGYQVVATGRKWRCESSLKRRYVAVSTGRSWRAKL